MLKMPVVFSDSMVLQRNKNIVVWGESDGDKVTVEINGCIVETGTINGKWSLYLPPNAGGRTLYNDCKKWRGHPPV